MSVDLVVFWAKEVREAEELVKASKGNDTAFVGVLRAKAILAVDEELLRLRRASKVLNKEKTS